VCVCVCVSPLSSLLSPSFLSPFFFFSCLCPLSFQKNLQINIVFPGATKTVKDLQDELKSIDLDSNNKMCLIEFLLFNYKKTLTDLFTVRKTRKKSLRHVSCGVAIVCCVVCRLVYGFFLFFPVCVLLFVSCFLCPAFQVLFFSRPNPTQLLEKLDRAIEQYQKVSVVCCVGVVLLLFVTVISRCVLGVSGTRQQRRIELPSWKQSSTQCTSSLSRHHTYMHPYIYTTYSNAQAL